MTINNRRNTSRGATTTAPANMRASATAPANMRASVNMRASANMRASVMASATASANMRASVIAIATKLTPMLAFMVMLMLLTAVLFAPVNGYAEAEAEAGTATPTATNIADTATPTTVAIQGGSNLGGGGLGYPIGSLDGNINTANTPSKSGIAHISPILSYTSIIRSGVSMNGGGFVSKVQSECANLSISGTGTGTILGENTPYIGVDCEAVAVNMLERLEGRGSNLYSRLNAQRESFEQGEGLPLVDLTQFDVALRVENLKPSGVSDRFTIPRGKQSITLYAFSDIQTVIYPTGILHVWVYEGLVAAEIPLGIDGESWRTYSSKIIERSEVGSWSVYIYHIKDAKGVADSTRGEFEYYEKAVSSRSRAGVKGGEESILSQEVTVVAKPSKSATLLGTYSFTVN